MKYWKYLLYVIRHKYYVFIECRKEGLIWQGIVHDLSKFNPVEFIPYTDRFFSERGYAPDVLTAFWYAWLHHQHRNKHHWNHWVVDQHEQRALQMPDKYVIEMICDWRAMGRDFKDTAKDFYTKNMDKIILHPLTRIDVERKLGIRKYYV